MRDQHRIISLDRDVVLQIAAGEVVQRPVNAVKELIDNALDAGSTQISLVVKEGGKKLLTIQDNGHGVQAEDLPLLCKRHATSKIRAFEDLASISTLGFRGEALASISTIAHLSVITKTPEAPAGWKVSYRNTELEAPGPTPCPAQTGTTFIIEDLFFNSEQRRKALGSGAEEYARILDLVGRYAVSRPDVAFSCKKQGERRPDLHTVVCSSSQDAIRAVYGAAVAQALLPILLPHSCSDEGLSRGVLKGSQCSIAGFVSCSHYTGRRSVYIIRINGHLVQCKALEHSLEAVYTAHARIKPFVYLDISIPGDQVDVNVHPTKHEVVFLHQEEIITTVSGAVEQMLQGPVRCKCSSTITHGPSRLVPLTIAAPSTEGGSIRVTELVRTDRQAQKLQSFFGSSKQTGATQSYAAGLGAAKRSREADADTNNMAISADAAGPDTHPLPSSRAIAGLLEDIKKGRHEGLKEQLQASSYVGMVDDSQMMVQRETELLLINIGNLARDLFYQKVLSQWGTFQSMQLQEPVRIRDMASLAVESLQEGVNKERITQDSLHIEGIIIKKASFLLSAAGIGIDCERRLLTSIPVLLHAFVPSQMSMPLLLFSLAKSLECGSEEVVVRKIAQALADAYSPAGLGCMTSDKSNSPGQVAAHRNDSSLGHMMDGLGSNMETWMHEHVLFPAIRSELIPQAERVADGSVIHLVSLRTLYKVFERC